MIRDFTMGTDPEFLLIHNKTVIRASNHVTLDDKFGRDGNGYTFEARPNPSMNPLVIIHEIRKIFVQKIIHDNKFAQYKWVAGSYVRAGDNDPRDFPLGGHIHFGIKNNVITHEKACRILDNYVGLISVLLENKDDGFLRRNDPDYGEYGVAGEFRAQTYGFEYRTPSSWIQSPYISTGIMCLGKAVMFEVLNNKRFTPLYKNYATEFKKMDVNKLRKDFPAVWESIKSMSLYKEYKPYLDLLYFLVHNGYSWTTKRDMRQTWGLFDTKPLLSNLIPVNVVWSRFVNK